MFGLPTAVVRARLVGGDVRSRLHPRSTSAPTAAPSIMAEYGADLFDESTVRDADAPAGGDARRGRGRRRRSDRCRRRAADGERDDLVTDAQRHRTTTSTARSGLGALVSRQARARPTRRPWSFDGRELTYAELDEWSDRLAASLVEDGAQPGAIVGVSLPRSVELIVALLAVAKSGAAFLPLDPDYPADRLAYMIADAEPAVVLDDAAAVRARPRRPAARRRLPDVDPRGVGVRAVHVRLDRAAQGRRGAARRHRQPHRLAAGRIPAGGPRTGCW